MRVAPILQGSSHFLNEYKVTALFATAFCLKISNAKQQPSAEPGQHYLYAADGEAATWRI